MSTITPKSLVDGTSIGASLATMYITPALTKTRVSEVIMTNSHNSAVTVAAHAIPSGGSATNGNKILDGQAPDGTVLSAGQTTIIPLSMVLEAGGFLQFAAGVAGVVGLRVSGVEITG